MLTLY